MPTERSPGGQSRTSRHQQVDLDQGGLADTLIPDPKGEEGGGVDRLTVSGPPAVDPACVMQLLLPDKVTLESAHSHMGGAQGERLQPFSQPPETLLAGPRVTPRTTTTSPA